MRRILYLATNRIYINKNMDVVTALIKSIGETHLFGPGFVDSDTLSKGVRYYVEKNGPFDFVVTDAVTLFWTPEDGHRPFLGSVNNFQYDKIKFCFKDMIDFFIDPGGAIPYKIFYPNFDPYNMTSRFVELLLLCNCFILTRDHKFWRKKSGMQGLQHENFAGAVNDNWADFVSENRDKIISFHGTVAETEFHYAPVMTREYDVGVPGVGYHSRRIAFKALQGENLRISPASIGYRRKFKSALFQIFRSQSLLTLYQDSFQRSIENTRMNFTCGSALGYAIRKFVEIPAKGSALLCVPFEGFQHAGYEPGVNCIAVDPNDILEVVSEVSKTPESLQKMASAGQNMVLSLHSFSARRAQLDSMLSKIIADDFSGSEWVEGDFIIHGKSKE